MNAVVDIGSVVMGFDARAEGRGVEELGIAEMSIPELKRFLEVGRDRG